MFTARSVVVVALPLAALLSACPAPPSGPGGDPDPDPQPTGDVCDVDGLEVGVPPVVATLGSGGDADFACATTARVVAPGHDVTIEGCIDVFGLGGNAKPGLRVDVFGTDQDPKTDVPAHGTSPVAITADAGGLSCDGADADVPACRATACDKGGFYRVAGVPTHTPVILKVAATGDNTVIDTYIWDHVFFDDDIATVEGEERINYEASLIYSSTYQSIPNLSGRLVDGMNSIDGVGRGVIAGEVHDCDDAIVQNATVTSSGLDLQTKVTYFDGDTEDPNPDLTRVATNTDGIFVVLNAATAAGANEHTVVAGGRDPACSGEDCQCIVLGSRTVTVYPDSVTLVTPRGLLPVVE